jgi:hypothetical protein
MAKTEKTEVATTATTEVAAVRKFPALARMGRVLHEIIQDTEDNRQATDEFVFQIMEEMLTADSLEELFAASEAGTVSGKDFIDRPFRLKTENIQWAEAKPEFVAAGGMKFFVRLNVLEIATGEAVTITTGAKSVLIAVFRMWEQKWLDQYDTDGGYPMVLRAFGTAAGTDAVRLQPYKVPR